MFGGPMNVNIPLTLYPFYPGCIHQGRAGIISNWSADDDLRMLSPHCSWTCADQLLMIDNQV